MGLLVAMTSWAAYAGGQLALAAVRERNQEAHLTMVQAQAAVAARSERSVAAQKAAAAADPAVESATTRLTGAYARRKILEAVYSGLEAKARVVSRELTRRTGSPAESRAARWAA